MSLESQVRSLLDVVTFILERLSPSENFDENIFSDYFRKHHDIVDTRHAASCHPEAIIIPESAAFQDDIHNHEEMEAEPNNPDNEEILFRVGDVDIMKMLSKIKEPTPIYERQGQKGKNISHLKLQSKDENTMTTTEKAIIIEEMDAFDEDSETENNGAESDSDNDDIYHHGDNSIEDFEKESTTPIKEDLDSDEYVEEDLGFTKEGFDNKLQSEENRVLVDDEELEEESDSDDIYNCGDKSIEDFEKESPKPIEVKVVSATIVNRKEDLDSVEYTEEEKMHSEEHGVLVGHGDFHNADFSDKSIEILTTTVSEDLNDQKVNFQEALNKIKIGKKLSRKKKNSTIIAHTCCMCQEHFKHKNLLIKHLKEQHNRMMCWNETCDFIADNMIEMMQHEKVHKKERFKCHICGREGLIAKLLLIHLKKKHLPNLSNDECPLCSFKGSWIERHIQMMHSQMECVCHICDKTMMGPGKLKIHIYQHHTMSKNFPCKTCNKVFTARKTLERHEEIHTVKEKTVPCDECDKKFLTIFLLDVHKKNCHKPKTLLCSKCDFVTNNIGKLNQHSVIHSEERPFQCHTCAKSFKTKEGLNTHEFYHTGIRKEECLVCGKKFKSRSNLRVHQRYHEGHYDAYCQPCDKKFVQKYNYTVHVEKHHAGEHLP